MRTAPYGCCPDYSPACQDCSQPYRARYLRNLRRWHWPRLVCVRQCGRLPQRCSLVGTAGARQADRHRHCGEGLRMGVGGCSTHRATYAQVQAFERASRQRRTPGKRDAARIKKWQAKMQEAAQAIDAVMAADDEDSRINPPSTPAFQRNSTNSLAMGLPRPCCSAIIATSSFRSPSVDSGSCYFSDVKPDLVGAARLAS